MAINIQSIRLGLMTPFTGLVHIYGQEIANAARIACAEINANGGLLGQPLELIVVDDGSVPQTALPAAQRLIDEFKCTAIIGNLLSNSRIAVAEQIVEPNRIPYLNFSFYEGSIVGRYFFHFAALPNQQIDRMIPYMAKKFGRKMFFAGSNYEWPRGSIDAAKHTLLKFGGEVLGEEYLSIGDTKVDDLLFRLARSGADVFVPYFAGSDQINLLTRFTELNLKSRIAVVMGHYDEAMAQYLSPEIRAGFYSSNTYFMSLDTAHNQRVLTQLATLEGINGLWPNGNGILTNFGEGAYVCVHAFAEAVRCAGSIERESLVDCLEDVQIEAPQGKVVMDATTHHACVNTFLAQCETDGQFTLIEKFGAIPPIIPLRYRTRTSSAFASTTVTKHVQYSQAIPLQVGTIVFDLTGRILHVNDSVLTLWGYQKASQLINKSIETLWADSTAWHDAYTNAHHNEQTLFRLNGKLHQGGHRSFEVLLDRNTDNSFTITCTPINGDSMVTPDTLVTRILQLTDIAIIACNEAGIILHTNDHASTMFGYDKNELTKLSVHQLLPPALRERHAHNIKMFMDDPVTMIPMGNRGEIVGYRKDGSQFTAEASLSKFRDNGHWVMLASIRDITKLKQQEEHSHWLATHDVLTGLPNRALIREHITNAINHTLMSSSEMALLFIDLDGISIINDSYGHEVGDLLLIAIGERLLSIAQRGDIVGRLDGKAFVVLREPCDCVDIAATLATRINDVVRQSIEIQERKLFVTASIGIVIGNGNLYTTDNMLRDADIAMRYVKEKGGDHWRIFSNDLQERTQRRVMITGGLRTALEQNELSLRLHPIVDAMNGTLRGAEVLLRWQPANGPISPDEFIPLAERNTTIMPIGLWVFGEACRIAAQLRNKLGEAAPYLSVNVSARQLSDEQLAEKFAERMEYYQVPASKLILELTETGLMTDTRANIAVLNSLAKLGLRIAVDDFGTGYSSLLQLLRLPLSILKIDKAFINGIEKRGEHYTIVDAVLKMSRALNLSTIAEGIEHQLQAELSRELGCDYLQGYYFSKPLYENEFMTMAMQSNKQALALIEDIYFIIYNSVAQQNLQLTQIYEILHEARAYNSKHNITGCLLYLDGHFMQYLEGQKTAVQTVMEIINVDPRHYSINNIIQGPTQKRLFRTWSMGFVDLNADAVPEVLAKYQANNSNKMKTIATDPCLAYNLFRAMNVGLMRE